MSFLSRTIAAGPKPAKHLALAVALATGSVLTMTAIAEPAHAQRNKKSKAKYSKAFVAAFTPIQKALNEAGDVATAKSLVPTLLPTAQSADEQMAAGNVIFSIGSKSQDPAMQFQGLELMLNSGKVALEQLGQFNFAAYQLSSQMGNQDQARSYLQQAINYNYSTPSITADALQVEMAETYFREDRFREGLGFLSSAIEQRKASGAAVDEQWYKRGMQISYNNEITPEVYQFVTGWIGDNSSPANWREAVNIARNLNTFDDAELLDILRLSYRKDALIEQRDFIDFLGATDARRTPMESKAVAEKGIATGKLSGSDTLIGEVIASANSSIRNDRADLPVLERDARATSSNARLVLAAGEAFLSYGQAVKAEEFFAKALTMPGVNADLANTRLGIAQADQGKSTEAKASFAKVGGSRAGIAALWSAHVDEMAGGM
jgi:tetratricopeptide (TPR) repeat protein